MTPLHFGQVFVVGDGRAVQVGRCGSYLGEVEDRQQQAGKEDSCCSSRLGFCRSTEEEVPLVQQEIPRASKSAAWGDNGEVGFRQDPALTQPSQPHSRWLIWATTTWI